VDRDRWYIHASWQRKTTPTVPLEALRTGEVIGVDTNTDHLAACKLDQHGNPVGGPKTFSYDTSGTAEHRDAQLRHALSHLLRWAKREGVHAIALEDLDFADSKSREKHGPKRKFRQLISGIPTGKLRARVVSMTAKAGISIITVDPAYTSKWGKQHWHKPLRRKTNSATSRHHAASVAIGRRALGHKIRRRVAPPRTHQSDVYEHRTTQAASGVRQRAGTCLDVSDTGHDPAEPTTTKQAGTQHAQHRSGRAQDQEHS
jgi:IS605 OrfB family transposase